jgi:hypothetical protein
LTFFRAKDIYLDSTGICIFTESQATFDLQDNTFYIYEAIMELFGDIFGGFMVILIILGFFLVALWFILPFVIFTMKGKIDSAYQLLEKIDQRLAAIEKEQRPAGRIQQEVGGKHFEAPS